jgi:protein SCO1
MQNKHTFSTNKIIALVIVVSGLLMTSLFVFHSGHKPIQPIISADYGFVFPVAREIKSFELISADNTKFTQKNFLNHWTLLFFGFTHCTSICPTTLDIMGRSFKKLHSIYPNLQVVLISLDPQRDTPYELAKYTRSFNQEFIGVTGKIQEIRKLQSQLGIFSGRDESISATNYQIQHTGSIMLIDPTGKWAGVFKFGMNPDQFAKNVDESVKSLSHA